MVSEQEEKFLDFLFKNINKKIICLDIGANKGYYSLNLLKKYNDKINNIHCFEPVDSNVSYCEKTLNFSEKVSIHNKGCYNEEKDSIFYKIVSNNIDEEGLSSLQKRVVFNNYRCEEIVVKLITINNYLDIPSDFDVFVKVDVEGFEIESLEGMSNLFMNKQILAVQFEYGDCIVERGKNLDDYFDFISKYPLYKIFDFDGIQNKPIEVNETNKSNYINKSWSNLYILKSE